MNCSKMTRQYLSMLGGALVLALVGSVAAGCGSSTNPASQQVTSQQSTSPASSSASTAGTSADKHRLAGIKYAQCMRAHGVNVLDPDQNGNIKIDAPDTPQAVVDRANQACQKLHAAFAAGAGMTPAQQAQAVKEITNYARCMRAHQVPMADPFTGPNGGVGYSIPRSVSPNSQVFKNADAACHHFLPNGG
jgi:hypothetical protein